MSPSRRLRWYLLRRPWFNRWLDRIERDMAERDRIRRAAEAREAMGRYVSTMVGRTYDPEGWS